MTETGINLGSIPWIISEVKYIYLYHLSLPAFPIPEADLARLKGFLSQLTADISGKYQVKPEFFVQAKHVLTGNWPNLLSENASYWRILTGLGLRGGRPVSKLLKSDRGALDLSLNRQNSSPAGTDLVYYLGRDEHFERFYPGRKWPSAIDVYLGCGGVIVYMAPEGGKLLERAREFYLPGLDPAYQNFDFYAPLLGMEDFERASEEHMRVWFSLFDVCIMETHPDPGIFIASRYDLDDSLVNPRSDIRWEEVL